MNGIDLVPLAVGHRIGLAAIRDQVRADLLREAMAVMMQLSASRRAGMTCSRPIFAVDKIPHRNISVFPCCFSPT